MSEAFDKILARKIREVFDNNKESMDLTAWEDMQARLDQKRKKAYFSEWIIRIAAVALLLFFLFIPVRQTEKYSNPETDKISHTHFRKFQNQQDVHSAGVKQSSQGQGVKASSDHQTQLSGPELSDSKKLVSMSASRKERKNDRISRSESAGLKKLAPITWSIPDYFTGLPHVPGIGENEKEKANLEPLTEPAGTPKQKDKVDFGIALSSLQNYSSANTTSEFNYAAGVHTDIKITQKLRLSTGLVMSKQYFTTDKALDVLYTLNSPTNRLNEKVLSSENRVELVGLDLPINLTYRIGDISLTAGFSSYAYIHEQFYLQRKTSYDMVDEFNNTLVKNKASTEKRIKAKPFDTFDLVGAVNLSAGYRFHWHNNALIIEPYIKHPLGDLTSRDIRFGSTGIRLQYVF